MKINYHSLVCALNILEKYSSYKLPQKINYAITKSLIDLEPHRSVYTRSLNNIFSVYEPYALKDENGHILHYDNGLYQIDDEHSEEYDKELTQLFNTEIEVNLCYIDFSVFDYDDGDKYDILSPAEIMELKGVLCKPEEENENG